ncbi:MAG: DUF1573 domain-containing protein [Cyclobacteriaceae bacterium]|nr:DUF1573 domain-containing protein [Cyclobacteriaceae bacterium]
MKLSKINMFAAIVGALIVLSSCGNNKEQEKKIAELEAKISAIQGSTPAATPTAAAEPEEKPEGPLPVFEFAEMEHDFGTIQEGDVVEHTFEFTNNGEAPLIIQDAKGSCGCTVPTWSKEPIPVGGKGSITAKFNSKGKPNVQNKTVTVTANTWPKQTRLRIKAMVTPSAGTATTTDGPVK